MAATTKNKKGRPKATRTEGTGHRWFQLPHGSISSILSRLWWWLLFVAITLYILYETAHLAASLSNDFVQAFLPGWGPGAAIIGCVTVASLVAVAIWLIRIWK